MITKLIGKRAPKEPVSPEYILRTQINTDLYSNCWHLKLGLVHLGASFLYLKGKLVLAVVFCTYCRFPTPVKWICPNLIGLGHFFNLLSLETYCILFSILVSLCILFTFTLLYPDRTHISPPLFVFYSFTQENPPKARYSVVLEKQLRQHISLTPLVKC